MFRHPTEVTCPDFRKFKSWFVLLVLPVLAPLPTLLRFTSSWQPMLDRRCLAAGASARYAFSDWLPATSFPQSCRVHNSKLNLGVPQIFYRSILYIYIYRHIWCVRQSQKLSKKQPKEKNDRKNAQKKKDSISLPVSRRCFAHICFLTEQSRPSRLRVCDLSRLSWAFKHLNLINVGLKDLSKFGTLEEIFKLFPEMREFGRISIIKKTWAQPDHRVVALLSKHGFWVIAEIIWAMGTRWTREKKNSPGPNKILLFAKSIGQNICFIYTAAKDSA